MDNKSKGVKTGKGNSDVLAKLGTGVEWSPGHAVKPNIRSKVKALSPQDLVLQKVGDALIGHFLGEQPRAERVAIVPGSLKCLDQETNFWAAKVQTSLFFPKIGPRIHQSPVRFKVQCTKNKLGPGNDHYSVYHNQVTFLK